jgi:hypothetical protein
MIVTPINKNIKSKSNVDYNEQLSRESDGKQVMWDDTKWNKAQIGEWFGFVQNGRMVTFRIVESIHPVEERLPSWSSNVGQGDRQVLYLGPIVRTMIWEDWVFYGGPKKVQGTMHVKTNVEHLMLYLDRWRE